MEDNTWDKVGSAQSPSSDEGRTLYGSFKIVQMTLPAGSWMWVMLDADGKHLDIRNGASFPSAEAAACSICNVLKAVGADVNKIEIWIEKKVRSRWKCTKEEKDNGTDIATVRE